MIWLRFYILIQGVVLEEKNTTSEASEMLDKRLKKINDININDDQIIYLLFSKFVKKMVFDNF